MGKTRARAWYLDNLRLLLIFLVVLGHTLEQIDGVIRTGLFEVIYTFHMPAFLFLSGYFAKFRPKKLLTRLVIPYLVFQLLYSLFGALILYHTPVTVRFASPYWIMWYLMAMVIYTLLLPLLDALEQRRFAVLGVSALTALLAGFDSSIGYDLSLSRAVVFLPFFAAGYYAGKGDFLTAFRGRRDLRLPLTLAGLAGIALQLVYLYLRKLPMAFFYGAMAYNLTDRGGPLDRLALGLFALCWILLLVLHMPDREIPLLTDLGRSTMIIYLLHGFAVYLTWKYSLFRYSNAVNGLLALGFALGLTLLPGLLGLGWSRIVRMNRRS